MPAPIIPPDFTRLLDRLEREPSAAYELEKDPQGRHYLTIWIWDPQGEQKAVIGADGPTLQDVATNALDQLHACLEKLRSEGLLPTDG